MLWCLCCLKCELARPLRLLKILISDSCIYFHFSKEKVFTINLLWKSQDMIFNWKNEWRLLFQLGYFVLFNVQVRAMWKNSVHVLKESVGHNLDRNVEQQPACDLTIYTLLVWPGSDLDPLQAPHWSVRVRTAENPQCLLGKMNALVPGRHFQTQFLQLWKIKK